MNEILNLILFSVINIRQPITYSNNKVLAAKVISLDKRYNDKFVNGVFKKNILLNLAYLRGEVDKDLPVNWEKTEQPFEYEFSLKQGETFAFHDRVLPQYNGKVIKTTNAHFNSTEGFVSDGYLVGDGVCHLASVIYWAAKEAGLNAQAPTNHDFLEIPEVPKEYGVSVFVMPNDLNLSSNQNLYITNNKQAPVIFKFKYDEKNLGVFVEEKESSA